MTPRIRQDLKATPAEEQGVKYFDVADPRSGGKMRLYDFEWLIAEQLNGQRRYDEVAEYARERLGIHPTTSDLEAYAHKLAELGFIEEMLGPIPTALEIDEPDTTPLPVPVPPSPPMTREMAPIDGTPEIEAEVPDGADQQMQVGTAKTMMAVAVTPPSPSMDLPPEPKPAPAPAPVTTVEKKPSAAPTPSQSAAMAAAAPASTGKVSPVGDEPQKSGSGSLILVVILLLAVGGVVAYMQFGRPQSAHVSVTLASPREVVRLYDGAGVVKKSEATALSFGEAGKVADVVAKGTETKPGMPLATLDSFAGIEKQLADVKDRLKYYENKLEQSKAKNDEAGTKTNDEKVAEKKKLMTELEARAAKVRLVAPSTGTVSEVLVAAGGDAKPGQPAIRLGEKRMSVELKAEGPKAGDTVQVQPAGGGATIAGKVTTVANGLVTVELPDDAPVKMGDSLRLVKKKEQNVIPVPQSAVTQRDGADVVFVLTDGEAHSRKVTIVDRSGGEALISSGLAPGDSVITSNAADLQEGSKASSQ